MAEHEQIGRFYTRSRKIPHLIGKTPQGGRIIGGPYTLTQIAVFVAVVGLLWTTRHLWFFDNYLLSLAMIPTTGLGLGFLAGRVPVSGRNPLRMAHSLWRALSAPPTGVTAGRPLGRRRVAANPYTPPPVPTDGSVPAPGGPRAAGNISAPARPGPGVSTVQALLAGGTR